MLVIIDKGTINIFDTATDTSIVTSRAAIPRVHPHSLIDWMLGQRAGAFYIPLNTPTISIKHFENKTNVEHAWYNDFVLSSRLCYLRINDDGFVDTLSSTEIGMLRITKGTHLDDDVVFIVASDNGASVNIQTDLVANGIENIYQLIYSRKRTRDKFIHYQIDNKELLAYLQSKEPNKKFDKFKTYQVSLSEQVVDLDIDDVRPFDYEEITAIRSLPNNHIRVRELTHQQQD